MRKMSRWIALGTLLTAIALALIACGGQAAPPPVAPTNTPLPPPPTEAPTSTPLPPPTDTPEPIPTEAVTNTSPPPTDTPAPTEEATAPTEAPTETAEKPSAELVEAANQIYTQKGCGACHGPNHEGGIGPILAGLPAEHIQLVTRNGEPEAGMPAFDQNAISDDDLDTLVEFLSSLTLQDVGVELSADALDHLGQAWDALQAGDKAGVETHLTKAQEAAADAPMGVQTTLKDVIEDMEEEDWEEDVQAHLKVLLGQ